MGVNLQIGCHTNYQLALGVVLPFSTTCHLSPGFYATKILCYQHWYSGKCCWFCKAGVIRTLGLRNYKLRTRNSNLQHTTQLGDLEEQPYTKSHKKKGTALILLSYIIYFTQPTQPKSLIHMVNVQFVITKIFLSIVPLSKKENLAMKLSSGLRLCVTVPFPHFQVLCLVLQPSLVQSICTVCPDPLLGYLQVEERKFSNF